MLPKLAKDCIGEKSESISLNTNQAGTRNRLRRHGTNARWFSQQPTQPKHRRSLQFLCHVRLHVPIRHCVVTHPAAKFWFFGSFFPAYATLGRKLHKRLRIWHEGVLQVGVDRNAAGRAAQESPPSLSLRVVKSTTSFLFWTALPRFSIPFYTFFLSTLYAKLISRIP